MLEENAPDLMTLEDENGVEHSFEVLDAIDYADTRYLAVVPYAASEGDAENLLEEDAELIIMKVAEENGEEFLDIVEDDEELYNVGGVFAERLQDMFDIE